MKTKNWLKTAKALLTSTKLKFKPTIYFMMKICEEVLP